MNLVTRLIGCISGFELDDGDGLVTWISAAGQTHKSRCIASFHTGYFHHKQSMAQLHSYLSRFFAIQPSMAAMQGAEAMNDIS